MIKNCVTIKFCSTNLKIFFSHCITINTKMEYCNDGDLSDYLDKKKPMTED